MAQSRFFSSVAQPTTLSASVSNSATAIPLTSTIGFPVNTPFTIALDYGGSLEELCDVTAVAGLTFTVTRAVDGTSAANHAVGAAVRHVSSARDFTEDNIHVNSNSGVHGVTGALVGTTDAQTLTNKTLTGPTINNPIFTGSAPSLILGITNPVGTSPLLLRAVAGQTVPTLNIQNSSSTSVFSVSAAGDLSVAGVGHVTTLTSTYPGTGRSSTTTLALDPILQTSALSAGTYVLDGFLIASGGSANAGNITLNFGGTSLFSAGQWSLTGQSGTTNSTVVSASVVPNTPSTNLNLSNNSAAAPYLFGTAILAKGWFTVSTPGTFGISWAQTSSSATAVALSGFLNITRVA